MSVSLVGLCVLPVFSHNFIYPWNFNYQNYVNNSYTKNFLCLLSSRSNFIFLEISWPIHGTSIFLIFQESRHPVILTSTFLRSIHFLCIHLFLYCFTISLSFIIYLLKDIITKIKSIIPFPLFTLSRKNNNNKNDNTASIQLVFSFVSISGVLGNTGNIYLITQNDFTKNS